MAAASVTTARPETPSISITFDSEHDVQSSPTTSPPPPETLRNHAPGIPDRRRSLRPKANRSRGGRDTGSGERRRSSGIANSLAEMASEMRAKDSASSDDEEKADTFEDAAESTPRPSTARSPDASPRTEPIEEDVDPIKKDTGLNPLEEVVPAQSIVTSPTQEPEQSSGHSSPTPQAAQRLSGSFTIPHPPPPSTAERKLSMEKRSTGDPTTTAPPARGENLARKASSGFGALFGRMNSIRMPARSPSSGPKNNENFSFERRNTATSMASVDMKPSLQDQFSQLRRQEEFGAAETNGNALQEEDENEGAETKIPQSPTKHENEVRPSRAASDPKLPPGTASGMTAGPASEPQEVNWDLWQQVVYEGPTAVARTSGEELKQAIKNGIPPAIRGVVWQVLAGSKTEELENVYRTLKARGSTPEKPKHARTGSNLTTNGRSSPTKSTRVTSDASSDHSDRSAKSSLASPTSPTETNAAELQTELLEEKKKRETASVQKLEKAIKRDMGSRTSYSKYTQSAGLQDGLFGVCKAYALFDEGVGYAQGINFITMPLLFNMSEEETFTLLVRLMSHFDLRSLFTADMPGLHLRLYQFERLLEDFEPAIYCHLRRRQVTPHLYATQWFLTLFAYRFPLQLVLRIYDLIFSEGLSAILKFGIVLMQRNRTALLEMKDMSQLTNFLKDKLFDVYIDKSPSASSLLDSGFFGSVSGGADKVVYRADDIVRDACSIPIDDALLATYTAEWETTQKTDRAREVELETLRTTNASLTTQVKTLEERSMQHDNEHVTIAQDIVRIKVENDALQDAKEALEFRVEELQKLVDRQPAEVEAKLKDEMERIMARNIEVQNENRALREEMDETEMELVNVKMGFAQLQSDHDSLKQKWQSVQAMLNGK
ncbi:hypothetical protein TI39_contig481g00011 [Zymoseptoria brevis]|uniref:GTPase-activating protein GYP5 n=1 Tax=Zymoseptoria brevis TaxID=1047168 RepID=A0A0F4GJJ8_9PEZI|nr:hypothetical protein TI39_contig481g00011 [Zymoseptoria brevis]